ncbi:MAG: saccharopine dehydrogenase NADP-binding domain-containing protein [Flavobacteriales bacterium]|nr:saccharopine dehydrogenase NADP-binding domain-containing protein [Flavobacteriales bacterium]
MKKILVLGAGKSASSLIKYLLDNVSGNQWQITVADVSESMARKKTGDHAHAQAVALDVTSEEERTKAIHKHDIVLSLLPPQLHELAAKTALEVGRNLVTASYTSTNMQQLDSEVRRKGLIFLNECGLDPGIDHMSAMKAIDHIKASGGELIAFRSYTGGLVAPESADNPWAYKFTWNPRNVVMAGQGTAKFIEDGKYRYIPYSRLFTDTVPIEVKGHGRFEGYANRDSLLYRKAYGIENIPTLIRGTLRVDGFCKAWDALIKLGWTDDSCIIHNDNLTYTDLLEAYLPKGNGDIKARVMQFLNPEEDPGLTERLEYLGLFDHIPLKGDHKTAAVFLQELLEQKWALGEKDIDMIVMQHQFTYMQEGNKKHLTSSLVVKGDDATYTAMAKTVGIPMGIAAKLILQDKIQSRGVMIPVSQEIYQPVLEELESLGIGFTEEEVPAEA